MGKMFINLQATLPHAIILATRSFGLAAILLIIAASCTKEEPKHRDEFRCEIDGVAWEAGCDSQNMVWSCDYIDCTYYSDSKSFTLLASNKVQKNGFRIRKTASDGGLSLGVNTISSIQFGRSDTLANECTLFNTFDSNSTLTILEINTSDKVIKGTLENIKLYSTCMDSILVSNLDFQVKYRP